MFLFRGFTENLFFFFSDTHRLAFKSLNIIFNASEYPLREQHSNTVFIFVAEGQVKI